MPLSPHLVTSRNGRFELDGAPLHLVGANNYYMAYASPAMRGAVLRLARDMGLNVLRCWAFLDCGAAPPGSVPPGAWGNVFFQFWNTAANAPEINEGPDGLERLDHLIADAEQAGLRLILPLVNHWPNFGGMDRYTAWFQAPSTDFFYRDSRIRAAYRNYVQRVLTRRNTVTQRLYRDEPAILAWELANEPRCVTRDGLGVLLDWVMEMSQWAKRWDPNHLLAVGDEGFLASGSGDLDNGSRGVDFEAFLRIDEIDFGSFHLYPQSWGQRDALNFGVGWIERRLAAGRAAGKPALLEEYGMKVGAADELPSQDARAAIYRAWLRAVADGGGAGDLAWMIAAADDSGKPYPDYDHFTVYGEPEAAVIHAHAIEMSRPFL